MRHRCEEVDPPIKYTSTYTHARAHTHTHTPIHIHIHIHIHRYGIHNQKVYPGT